MRGPAQQDDRKEQREHPGARATTLGRRRTSSCLRWRWTRLGHAGPARDAGRDLAVDEAEVTIDAGVDATPGALGTGEAARHDPDHALLAADDGEARTPG